MDTWQTIVVVSAGALTLFNLGDKIIAWIKAIKKPTNDLEERVSNLERKVEGEYKLIFASYDEKLQRDYDAINSIKRTMNLIVEAQWVLVDHAKNGNNEKELNNVSEKLKEFVFDK